MLCGSHVEHCLREGPATWLHRVACRGWQVRLARVESVSLNARSTKKKDSDLWMEFLDYAPRPAQLLEQSYFVCAAMSSLGWTCTS